MQETRKEEKDLRIVYGLIVVLLLLQIIFYYQLTIHFA
jgi:hypothetical protein